MNKYIIIVPLYNVEDWILNNLSSVLSQTYTNYEVYYTDDLSTDDSHKVLVESAPPHVNVYKNTEKALALKNIYDTILRADPNDEDIKSIDFRNYIGDILVEVMEEQLKNGKIIFDK